MSAAHSKTRLGNKQLKIYFWGKQIALWLEEGFEKDYESWL